MNRARFALRTLVVAAFAVACTRSGAVDSPVAPAGAATDAAAISARADGRDAADAADAAAESDAADAVAPWAPDAAGIDGPHEELRLDPVDGGPAMRPAYYAFPAARSGAPRRLIAHLHGVCGACSYAAGKWLGAATSVGALVCPTGNARCGSSLYSAPSWEASNWGDLVATMDRDLESSIVKVLARHPRSIDREGAVLTGYSRGGYAAPVIARKHPGRWPYLVLIEANAPLSLDALTASGVRAVALVAGEQGLELAGMRKTADELSSHGYRCRLFLMPRTGHPYSDNMEYVMHDALSFVLSEGP